MVTIAALAAASWWSPFGWQAYSPRLLAPWVFPAAFVCLIACRDQIAAATTSLLRRPAIAGIAAVLLLALGIAQLGMFLNPGKPFELFQGRYPACRAVEALEERVAAGDERLQAIHTECLSHLAWRADPVMASAYEVFTPALLPYGLLYAGAVGGLIATARPR